uniref:Regulatory-associated protein of mTOR n=1 Tax=Timema cristinae TaxID=61476 RepID=A0A7R9D523_TIMCR|nr:unnamed protein product [Timema cristinae]
MPPLPVRRCARRRDERIVPTTPPPPQSDTRLRGIKAAPSPHPRSDHQDGTLATTAARPQGLISPDSLNHTLPCSPPHTPLYFSPNPNLSHESCWLSTEIPRHSLRPYSFSPTLVPYISQRDYRVSQLSQAHMGPHTKINKVLKNLQTTLDSTWVPPHESRVMTWREHTGWVVDVSLRAESQGTGMAVSGCVAGDVRLYDLRRNSSVSTCQTSQGMTAMSVHSAANTFACGSVNQYISVYNMAGVSLNTIKYHEGFMGPRIGPVSCLQFHPHRVCLAAGSMDNSISIYSVDPKR